MKVELGKEGLAKTWQKDFPEETTCVHCSGNSRIGFVAHELGEEKAACDPPFVCSVNKQGKDGKFWLHDCCAVAVYFCEKCLFPTALYNQG